MHCLEINLFNQLVSDAFQGGVEQIKSVLPILDA